jgi:hypothetical protein
MRTMVRFVVAMVGAAVIVSCGSSGGSGGGQSLQPPAFTNLAGTRWAVIDKVSAANNTCGAPLNQQDSWTLHVVSQSGNTITFYDERGGAGDAVNGTMSGYLVSYSGARYAIDSCSNMTASYSMTVNNAGTAFSGSATINCTDAPGCSVPVSVTGTKMPIP